MKVVKTLNALEQENLMLWELVCKSKQTGQSILQIGEEDITEFQAMHAFLHTLPCNVQRVLLWTEQNKLDDICHKAES